MSPTVSAGQPPAPSPRRKWGDRLQGVSRRFLTGIKGSYLFWALVLCLSAAFLWSAFSGSRGIFSLVEQRENTQRIDQENRKILEQNQRLKKEIYLLQTSPSYLRKVAREELGYIAEGEKIYLPPDTAPRAPDTDPGPAVKP